MRIVFLIVVFFVMSFYGNETYAKLRPEKYGLTVLTNPQQIKAATNARMDSFLSANKMLVKKQVVSGIATPRVMTDQTIDFYLLVLLCILLGVVTYTDPRYFNNLWRVFTTPGQSTAARDQMDISVLSNALMNLFFVIVGGAYVFYLVGGNASFYLGSANRSYFILTLIGGVSLIYFIKYVVLRFTGWAFKIKQITEYYIFNVFLMNKIMAIVLLPLVIILAFADKGFHNPVVIISAAVIILLFLNRYLRSWRAFGSFFQYSRFHFFTYLCASEILPLAVLMKLLVNGFGF
jgi:hypothetical protein